MAYDNNKTPAGLDKITSTDDIDLFLIGDISDQDRFLKAITKDDLSADLVGSATQLTGIVQTGPIVTLNTDIKKINIAAHDYWIQGLKYFNAGSTAVSPTIAAGDSSTFVGADSTGIIYSPTKFTDEQTKTIIPLDRLQSVQGQSGPGSDLQTPIHISFPIGQVGYVDRSWIENCVGALYASGGTLSENSTTPLQIDQSSGVVYSAQRVPITITGSQNISTANLYNIAGVPTMQPAATLAIPKYYDNGTDLVILGNNKYASHTLLRAPKDDNSFFLVYSNAEYASQGEAEAALVDYSIFTDQATSTLIPVARFILKGDSTNVISIVDERPLFAGSLSSFIGTATMQQIFENSLDPEIVTDLIRQAFSVKGGTGIDTDPVYEGKDNAGGLTFSVHANGDVEIHDTTKGIILTSPDTTRYRITVDNIGVLSTAVVV